ncbi:MAG: insulinase family protein [Desulfuromonas sp.]|nr:MAG: insulinase family protein [Desulfuromonas sp.]
MLRKLLLPLLLLFLLPAAVSAMKLEEKVQEHTFANGLKLLVVERHASPTFAAYITLGVGAVDETSRSRGAAHLLEHMLFKGTKTLGTTDFAAEKPLLEQIETLGNRIDLLKVDPEGDPAELQRLRDELAALQQEHKKYVVKDEFSRIYSENGGTGYNAFTSKDQTTYIINLPANKLELWAAIESDRMKNPVLREFYTERDVILEERRMRYESSPRGLLYENLIANAFKVHPYRNPIIGWNSDIANLTLPETRDFLQRYYAPINTVITIVGDVDFTEVVAMVDRYFGDIDSGVKVPPVAEVEPPQKGEKRVEIEFDAEPSMAIAYHKPTMPSREDYAFDLIDMLLSGGPTSRLYRSLVVDKQIASRIGTYGAPGSRYPNLFVISAVPFPGKISEVEQAIYAELKKLAEEPVSPEEINRIRKRLRTDQVRSLKSNSGLARSLAYFQVVADDWRYLVEYDKKIAEITTEEIMQAAQNYFRQQNRTVVVLSREDGVI